MEKLLRKANVAYHNGETPIMSDTEYDNLKEFIEKSKGKDIKNVGASISGEAEKVKLPIWMGSLDKPKDITSWLMKHGPEFIVMDKLDGISGCLIADDKGYPKHFYTRGNGSIGENVSFILAYVNLPKQLWPFAKIRGEFLITRKAFTQLQKNDETMKNARTTVSGVVNSRKNHNQEILQHIKFIAYDVYDKSLKKKDQLIWLDRHGLQVVNHKIVVKPTQETFETILKERFKKSDYDIDGIVISDNSNYYPPPSKGNPSYSVAFKSNTYLDTATTRVVSIIWKESKDMFLKPVIEVEPVTLDGITIKKTTGFNAKYIEDNKLGPGAIVKIVRSGMVIPYISDVLSKADVAQMPNIPYIWNDSHVDILSLVKGKDAIVAEMQNFCDKLGIKGAGPSILGKLYDHGVKTIKDLVNLKPGNINNIPGVGIITISKITNSIKDNISKADPITLIVATNYLGKGYAETKLRLLEEHLNTIESFKKIKSSDISKVKGFSVTSAEILAPKLNNFPTFVSNLGLE
jgi:NAD-dependent DNA ligase